MSKIQIVIPMAGHGSRFAVGGYDLPKPLIEVRDRTMIAWVIENLNTQIPSSFTFVALREHQKKYAVHEIIGSLVEDFQIIWIDGVTSGAAQTALIGCENLEPDSPLVIANSDQYISRNLSNFMEQVPRNDGTIMTMPSRDPKWSYVLKNEIGNVIEVAEKQVISDEATVGIYGFSRVSTFVDSAKAMIASGEKVSGEYYVAPSYNHLIKMGKTIKTFNVGSDMHGVGTPEDLRLFLSWLEDD
jgi:NDP-sugar pyrophosphorylase family protein